MALITDHLNEEFSRARLGSAPSYVQNRIASIPPSSITMRRGGLQSQHTVLTSSEIRAFEQKASMTKGGADIHNLMPPIRDPRLNPDNFYLPSFDPKGGQPHPVLNQWIEHYFKFHPLVGNAIEFHAQLPISRFGLTGIDDPEILQVYETMCEDMNLLDNMYNFLKCWWLFGEVMPYLWWSENYNRWVDMTFIDTSSIRVVGHYLAWSEDGDSTSRYELQPDEYLLRLVRSPDPYDRSVTQYIDPEVIHAVRHGYAVELDPFSTELIANKAMPWDLRGTSIIMGILKDLLYSDTLRLMQNSIAMGHIMPKWIWKLGSPGPDGYMPTDSDLQAFRELLLQANQDPMFSIITHYAVTAEVIGSSGKVMPITPELDWVDKRILTRLFTNKAITTGEGQNFSCYDDKTEVLTENGFKFFENVEDDEAIATFNSGTGQLEYQLPTEKYIYDYDSSVDGKMVHFSTAKIDIMVTPNHQIFSKPRLRNTWGMQRADEIKQRAVFRSCLKWEGIYQDVPQEVIDLFKMDVSLEDWCRLVGYYASEGWSTWHEKSRNYNINIGQTSTSAFWDDIKDICVKFGFNVYKGSFSLAGKDKVSYFEDTFGHYSANKHIPKWMKNLPVKYLRILLDSLVNGDGHRMVNTKKKPSKDLYYFYTSVSKQLADDVFEIALKLGNSPTVSLVTFPDKPNSQDQYSIHWSDSKFGRFPALEGVKPDNEIISRADYKGKVYCFEVPNHLFVTRRNGKVTIQGNSASVAMRAMMSRYIPVRGMMESFFERKMFLPVALANGYMKRKTADLAHSVRTETKGPLVPTFNWAHKQSLLDDTAIRSAMLQMRQNGDMPLKIICDALEVDYDECTKWLEMEQGTIADRHLVKSREQFYNKAVQTATNGMQGILNLEADLPRTQADIPEKEKEAVPDGYNDKDKAVLPVVPDGGGGGKAPSSGGPPTGENKPKSPTDKPKAPLGGESGEKAVAKSNKRVGQSRQDRVNIRNAKLRNKSMRSMKLRKHGGDDLGLSDWQERLQLSKVDKGSQSKIVDTENNILTTFDSAKSLFTDRLLQSWRDRGSLSMSDIEHAVRDTVLHVNETSEDSFRSTLTDLYSTSRDSAVDKLKRSKRGRAYLAKKRASMEDDRKRNMDDALNGAFARVTTVSTEVLDKIRDMLHANSNDVGGDIVKTLFADFDEQALAGLTENELLERLGELWDKQRYIYQRIVRTETMNMYSRAALQEWWDAGIREVTRREINDHRTCPYCRSIDGNVYSLEKVMALDYPLIQDPDTKEYLGHPNCRGSYEQNSSMMDWDDFIPPAGSSFTNTTRVDVGDSTVNGLPVELVDKVKQVLEENDIGRNINVVPDVVDTVEWLNKERSRITKDMESSGQPVSDMRVDLQVQENADKARGTVSMLEDDEGNLLVSGFSFFSDDPGWFVLRSKAVDTWVGLDPDLVNEVQTLYDLKIKESTYILEEDGIEIIGSPVGGKAVGFVTPAASQDVENYFIECYSLYKMDSYKIQLMDQPMFDWLKLNVFDGVEYQNGAAHD